ncbi:MAG: hypothetical protein RLZZ460_494, partial [Chloroflexota bacterium]
ATARAVQIDTPANYDDLTDRRRLVSWANRAPESNHIKCCLFISQGQVLVARGTTHRALHLAGNRAIA